MYPYDVLFVHSECIDKPFCILDSSIIFTELSHTLGCDLAVWMEEFVDEVDDDECARHKALIKNRMLCMNYFFARNIISSQSSLYHFESHQPYTFTILNPAIIRLFSSSSLLR